MIAFAQLCPTLCDPMDCSLPGSSVHWIFHSSTGMDCHFLLHGIFPTQGSNPGLLHCRQTLYCLSHQVISFRSLLKLMSIEAVMPSNHLILCHPLLHLPSIFPNITVFSNESVLRIRWPKDWSFSFSISPSSEYSGLISFTMDWLDLLAV